MPTDHLHYICFAVWLLFSTTEAAPNRVYFGTDKSEGIYTAIFDDANGTLGPISLAVEVESPGFLAAHPKAPILYSTNAAFENPENGGVSAFTIETNGQLTPLSQQPSHGRGTCHLSVDPSGQTLVAVNYGTGNVLAYSLNQDGSLAPSISQLTHSGSGADPKRQKGPHPHSAFVHPTLPYVYVCDLGIDKIMIYRLNTALGQLTPSGEAIVPGGAQGPRHLKFSPDGKQVYVLNELSHTVSTFKVIPESGQLSFIDSQSVFSETEPQPQMTSAEIRMHPSGRWLYTSTRDLTDQGRDVLTTFARNEDGSIKRIAQTAANVAAPRNFNLSPNGQWLIAAGQRSQSIAIFSVTANGELILEKKGIPFPGQPICIEFFQP